MCLLTLACVCVCDASALTGLIQLWDAATTSERVTLDGHAGKLDGAALICTASIRRHYEHAANSAGARIQRQGALPLTVDASNRLSYAYVLAGHVS